MYPSKVIDVQSLAGDSSDNIPGVPGIGVKTAAELINQYGGLEQLLTRATEIKQNKRRENLIEYADQARLSRSLVTLKKDVPVKSKIDEFKIKSILEPNKLIPFLKAYGFKSLLNKYENVEKEKIKDKSKVSNINIIKNDQEFKSISKNYYLIENLTDLKLFIDKCYDKSNIAVDCETDSLNAKIANLVGLSLSFKEGEACYIPLKHGINLENKQSGFIFDDEKSFKQIPFDDAISLIKPLLEDNAILKIGHNIKYDALVMKQEHNGNINLNPVGDTMCITNEVDKGRVDSQKLDALAIRELNYDTIKYEDI